ncbi:hypothetical protein DYI37_12590 [Fulvimarina endophytica]|uniref:CheA signal transduction histidine kinase n=1 Tax=Fulvimarina endophytica TaxID=2293836 RepID=A0A371X0Q6_9HYPH|nr:hypothetical protein [Fulvimarina endophytica]RFC62802.1 hypothetical protein DYI37_12590 [Fulvimarina endophytica]
MADLSGVLRKTIDGLPRSTPDMRARVYEKARAAIQRQIQAANPPLSPEVADARLAALEDAIGRTEDHYVELENGPSIDPEETAVPPEPEPSGDDADADDRAHHDYTPAEARSSTDETIQAEVVQDRLEEAPLAPTPGVSTYRGEGLPRSDDYGVHTGRSNWGAPSSEASGTHEADAYEDDRRRYEDDRYSARTATGFAGAAAGATTAEADAAAYADYSHDDRHPDERNEDRESFELDRQGYSGDFDGSVSIPEADVSGPAYVPPREARHGNRGGSMAAILSLVVIVGGLGAVAWFYGDEISGAILGEDQTTVADGAATDGTDATQTAAGDGSAATSQPGAQSEGTRQFTQRLLPDGSEVDEGPAEREENQFGEGTDVAAASVAEDAASEGTSPTVSSEIGQEPQVVGGETPETAASAEGAEPAPTTSQADPSVPVAQRAVFYQERTGEQPGTQETGNVVWSVVQEPPIEGQPPEPAIRAVADIPEENMTMTMTIRRNADPTLPASHVIELLFDTPDNFPGGDVATVQRLALKQTEQARGEPLIGVAGKISDGFFIIALNNLDQAVQNNLALLEDQEWIDIPIAYATGRRALVSIEKGLPGDRVFKEAIQSWDNRT